MAEQTVPDELIGCWQRAWIEFDDGNRDDTAFVIWLQLPHKMADLRVQAERPDLRHRAGFSDCSLDELRALATTEASGGHTNCTAIEVGIDGIRRATAEWFTRGYGIAFHPVSVFPEPGLLEWNDDGTVMVERAPSGAYTEEWHRLPNTSTGPLEYRTDGTGTVLYIAGDVAVYVRDRTSVPARLARLPDLIDDCGVNRDAIETLLDCEFSFARRHGAEFVIKASTHPWREGAVIDVDFR